MVRIQNDPAWEASDSGSGGGAQVAGGSAGVAVWGQPNTVADLGRRPHVASAEADAATNVAWHSNAYWSRQPR